METADDQGVGSGRKVGQVVVDVDRPGLAGHQAEEVVTVEGRTHRLAVRSQPLQAGEEGDALVLVLELDRDQVDLANRCVVVHGKGNKERRVYFDDLTEMLLREYLADRHDDEPALFVSLKTGARLKPGGVRAMLNKVAEKAGIEHVHPHKFQRTLATNLARRGMPIQEVASLLGHDKLDTTMQYVVLDERDKEYSYRRYAG